MKKLISTIALCAAIISAIATVHTVIKGESFILTASLLANSLFCLATFLNWKNFAQ